MTHRWQIEDLMMGFLEHEWDSAFCWERGKYHMLLAHGDSGYHIDIKCLTWYALKLRLDKAR